MPPKKFIVLACCVVTLLVPNSLFSSGQNTDMNQKNANLIAVDFTVDQFERLPIGISTITGAYLFDHVEKLELSSKDQIEMQEWYLALRKAAMLLPTNLVKEIATDLDDHNCGLGVNFHPECIQKKIRFEFFADSTFWGTAYPRAINLRASATELPDWMTWEPFPKDGYTEEERIFVALHEFAHRYDESMSLRSRIDNIFEIEPSPTLYGCANGYDEDFADTFALYVMFPDYLKPFSLRYKVVKNIVGREYDMTFKMPNSVRSKIVNPIKGCREYKEEVARKKHSESKEPIVLRVVK